METRQQRLIRQALEHGSKKPGEETRPEASLRDKSLEHTAPDYVPKTLTPHEWELYYQEHGVPASHRRKAPEATTSGGLSALLRRLFGH